MPRKNYSLRKPGGYGDRTVLKKRLEMFRLFSKEFPENALDSVLDVGVTAEKEAISANFFEENFADKSKITALSDQDASFLESRYPGLKFMLGDAKALPFEDASIDVVFSSAVIEHVGSLKEQAKMIAECFRVCKKGVFITTPNRWFPFELHTSLPFLHWLPKKIHRAILKAIGLRFYALEQNLNLMDCSTLSQICRSLNIQNFKIKKIVTFGCVSNLVLVLKK